jgi:D-serine deaminase-like pyridoxal phosphate-dependent protein
MMSMLINDLLTPALLLDSDILERNLSWMQKKASGLGSALRPHIKTHKCIHIGKRQRELGAKGITVSTFYEAEKFAEAGFEDITWAFPIPPAYAMAVVELARKVTLRVVIDSGEAIQHLEQACKALGASIHVWLKVDCGYHRAGVDPASPLAEDLVRDLAESKLLLFDGILSHSGHAYNGTTRDEILQAANQEREVMVAFARRMRKKGYPLPGVSIGSTPAMSVVENLDGVTEVRPGNYCFYDRTMTDLGICGVDDCAVSVLASVISHQRGASHFVIDAGALSLSKDTGVSPPRGNGAMGALYDDYGKKRLHTGLALKTLSQEHGKVIADQASEIEGKFSVGAKVRILENHSCLTVANFDEYHVVRGDEVVDRWKILRGRI